MCEYITFCFHLRFESGNRGVRRGVRPGSIPTHPDRFFLKKMSVSIIPLSVYFNGI